MRTDDVGPQTVGGVTAIVSATIGALALLLNWHRGRDPRRPRLASVVAVAVCGAGTIAVLLLVASAGSDSEGSGARLAPARLTAAQYRASAGSICARLSESTDRLKTIRPRGSVGSVTAEIEQTAIRELRRLRPPLDMAKANSDAVALWTRRVTLIEEAYRQADELSDKEAIAQLAEVDRLTRQLNRRLRSLGLRECLI